LAFSHFVPGTGTDAPAIVTFDPSGIDDFEGREAGTEWGTEDVSRWDVERWGVERWDGQGSMYMLKDSPIFRVPFGS
jgi:hypothetical protein